ncbi:MAG: dihydroorotate dehydrogenase-like protein [Opitutales bacterium]|nr:dihydroorotate dehydrogenase-like protein [Opitutales bacterium]MCH8539349.1 dihydroorotate dehydrogenase-like protein [Opitutales bacterium]
MSLRTEYLSMELRSPLVAAPSPLTRSLDNLRKMEDDGIGAVVLYSLFQEQIEYGSSEVDHFLASNGGAYENVRGKEDWPESGKDGPAEYLEYLRAAKEALEVPVIASLNGRSLSSWVLLARNVEQAGADGLELNVYSVPGDPALTGAQMERNLFDIVRAVRSNTKLPLVVKMSPYFSSPANVAHRLVEEGADGLVLFNRFYQPDIDLENLSVEPNILLSTSHSSRLALRWIALLSGRLDTFLAASGGVLTGGDAAKMILAGADVTQLCSTLLRNGLGEIRKVEKELLEWMEKLGFASVEAMRSSLSQIHLDEPELFERAQYMRGLKTYDPLQEYRKL